MSIRRRRFIQGSAAVGGSLVLGVNLTGCGPTPLPHAASADLQPNAFLQLSPDGQITLQLHKSEMGQGTYTGMATMAAEELNMPPSMLHIEQAQFHPDFIDPDFYVMLTGGSSSIRTSFEPLRKAAASLAYLLRSAAAEQAGVDIATVMLRDGKVYIGDLEVKPASLIDRARQQELPEEVPLKAARDYRFIGKHNARLDARAKVTGQADFGLDAQYPGALSAVLVRCPHFGGSLKRFDDSAALAGPGGAQVPEVDGDVAVLAVNYLQAAQGGYHIHR